MQVSLDPTTEHGGGNQAEQSEPDSVDRAAATATGR